MKKTGIAMAVFILIFMSAAPSAQACPYIQTSCTDYGCYGSAVFSYVNGAIQVNVTPDQITNTSSGKGDKLVKLGAYLTIYNPEHPTWDFKINQTPSGSYSISSDGLIFQIQSSATGGAQYLRGNMTEMSLNLNTGEIAWGTVTDLSISNPIKSSTLNEFVQGDYNAINVTQFTLTSMYALQQWISNPHGSFASKYCITLTGAQVTPSAAPEPAEWILLLAGLMLMGGLARRRAPFPARS